MRRCPRFPNCSAPICPLDTKERTGPFKGEAKCTLGKELLARLSKTKKIIIGVVNENQNSGSS